MELRIIKNEQQYGDYLSEVARLAVMDPAIDSENGFRLELLAKLVEDYERARFDIPKPDPIDAVLFRMEQDELRQKDVAKLFGGSNRASEVLARKRPLTLPMIRNLHEHLAIPLELLVRETSDASITSNEVDKSQVPLEMLVDRGWIEAKATVDDLLQRFSSRTSSPVMLRNTRAFGSNRRTNVTHVWLWLSRIREVADADPSIARNFDRGALNMELIHYVSRLSYMANGPRLAKDCLAEHGVALVIEPHLPKTHLDGAAMFGNNGTPVIGLTLREDRLDNFWFTLIHELVHAWKHLEAADCRTIVDENVEKYADDDDMEREANDLAKEILIPTGIWRRSNAFLKPSPSSIRALAAEQRIAPAIVAGRIRFESKNYSRFSKMVGYRQARASFPDIRWP